MAKHTKPRRHWTSEQIEILVKHYPNKTPGEMNKLLSGVFTVQQFCDKAKKLQIRKSDDYRARFGISKDGRRIGGSQPWNKGIRYEAHGRSAETRFKPGSTPPNRKPVGTIRTNVDGYLEIKTEDGMFKWRFLHREIWKQHHGTYPPQGFVLIFKDGNKQNCDISNLELLTRRELILRNHINNMPEELREVTRLSGVITRKINERTKTQHNGTA